MKQLAVLPVLACVAACNPAAVQRIAGESTGTVSINSAPDPAWIFVDGVFVGRTPVATAIAFTHATHFVEIVAVPMHANQTRQVLRIVPPSLPSDLQFFLDNQDPGAVTR